MRSGLRSTLAALAWLGVAGMLVFPLACSRRSHTGPEPISYDRDTCERCQMLISDSRYAAEVRLPGERHVHKFDDLGDALAWLAEHQPVPAVGAARAEIWVRDADRDQWLDARTASYSRGAKTPMNFGFAAHAEPAPGRLDFDQVRTRVRQIVKERRRVQ